MPPVNIISAVPLIEYEPKERPFATVTVSLVVLFTTVLPPPEEKLPLTLKLEASVNVIAEQDTLLKDIPLVSKVQLADKLIVLPVVVTVPLKYLKVPVP